MLRVVPRALSTRRTRRTLRAVPYTWSQTLKDVTVLLPVPKGTKGKDVVVTITKTHLTVGLRGQAPAIDVSTALVCRGSARRSAPH